MSRVVCWFSCGSASAIATKLALAQFAGREIVIARCVIDEEHEDNNRFASDCEAWFGHPIVNLTSEKWGSSIEAVFDRRKAMSFIHGAPCTMLLKKEVREDFQQPTDTHVFGYCAEEQDRWDSFLDANNIDAIAPLIERSLEHQDTLAMIERAGIALPTMYLLNYKHNNCKGCVKSKGAGYWNKIRTDFPIVFDRRAAQSRRLGVRLVEVDGERVFLDELPTGIGRYQDEPEIQCGIFCEMAQQEYRA
jgi:hypothetical protein